MRLAGETGLSFRTTVLNLIYSKLSSYLAVCVIRNASGPRNSTVARLRFPRAPAPNALADDGSRSATHAHTHTPRVAKCMRCFQVCVYVDTLRLDSEQTHTSSGGVICMNTVHTHTHMPFVGRFSSSSLGLCPMRARVALLLHSAYIQIHTNTSDM